jgi:hypothetical protein
MPSRLDEQEPERRRRLFEDVLLPGAVAGVVGALVMVVLAMMVSAIVGDTAWKPAVLVSGVFFRGGPSETVWTVLLGAATHFAVGIAFGTAFALVLPRGGTQVAALLLGFGFGLALQVLMPSLVIPYLAPPLARNASPAALWLLHLAFGAALGLVPTVRKLMRDEARVAPAHS